MSVKRVLMVGCGDLGIAAGARLQQARFTVAGARRNTQALPDTFTAMAADITRPDTLADLAAFKPDILIYAVAANGRDDAAYQAAYVDGLRNTLAALTACALQHALFVSSTRVYGEANGRWCDEQGDPQPADFGGERLWQAEQVLAEAPYPATALRLSGIYGPGRRRMLTLATEPSRWPADNRWTNRIHRDDAAAFIAYLVQRIAAGKPVEPCYNVSDDMPTPQHEVLHWLAAAQGVDVAGRKAPAVAGGKR
ncbi:MAG TPA: NAD-dependent epimerase/dehydratase family protein, partial [Pseudomonadales bacterium]